MITSPRLAVAVPVSLVIACACAFAWLAACGAFGSDTPTSGAEMPDARASAADAAEGGSTTARIRCGSAACAATQKCCLPADGRDAGCVERSGVCAAGLGELLCSSPAACNSGEVCCVTSQRNGGQTGFDITRSFCVAASACPDQKLQRSLCDLGTADQCPAGKACKPYLRDVNDLNQDLDINPAGYATCQ
jgi:hypothetical protein